MTKLMIMYCAYCTYRVTVHSATCVDARRLHVQRVCRQVNIRQYRPKALYKQYSDNYVPCCVMWTIDQRIIWLSGPRNFQTTEERKKHMLLHGAESFLRS